MKTFRVLGIALAAVMFGFAMSACSDDDDEYMKELETEFMATFKTFTLILSLNKK